MTDEFVIGVDSSTQTAKAVAWSREGRALGEGRAAVPMSHPAEGRCEQDPEDWWRSFCAAVKQLGEKVNLSKAAAAAISNQRETVGFISEDGAAVRPGIVWIDERASEVMRAFADYFGPDKLHRITGKPPDITPVVYRLYWMRLNEPENLEKTAAIVDVHGFLVGRLTGKITASWTSAGPFGVFDISEKAWSPDIIAALDIPAEKFPETACPGARIGEVTAEAARQTGLPEGLPLIAAGGDGQCAGLGVNAVRKGAAYLNLGTALVTGAWDAEPRISLSWRTMSSPTGEGYFLEGVLRAGTYFIDWLVKNAVAAESGPGTFAALEAEAAAVPAGSDGLLVSPFLSGSMNPYWSMDVRAAFVGLRPLHGRGHFYRATLESLTGWIARSVRDMKRENVAINTIIAVGGGANSPLWLQMIADATGLPIQVSNTIEASSLGAGMTAAAGIGWRPSLLSAAEAMSGFKDSAYPSERNRLAWEKLMARQEKLDTLLVEQSALTKTG